MTPRITPLWAWIFLLIISPLASAESIEGRWMKSTKDVVIDLRVTDGELVAHLMEWKNKQWTTDDLNPREELRSRPLKGIPVLFGLMKKEHKWVGGHIYDASEGETYRAAAWLEDDNSLVVRGYIGVSLLGKTTKWKRQ